MAGRVDADAGIAVFPPGAAEFRVLLDDRVGIACFGQLDAGGDAAHAAADHQHVEVLWRGRTAGDELARDRRFEAHLVIEHRDQAGIDVFADADAHHVAQEFGLQRFLLGRGGRGQECEEAVPQILRHGLGHIARRVGGICGGEVGGEAVKIGAVLRERRVDHQQRWNIRIPQRGIQASVIRDRQRDRCIHGGPP